MTDINIYRKMISETFKDLKINKFTLLGKGKAGIICLVNDEIVFKIPLYKEGEVAEWQKNEAVVLKYLEGKLDIEIPKILYTGTSECGLYIIGETLLSGTTLSYELYDSFDEETRNEILRQLGRIVRSLHEAGGHDPTWHDPTWQIDSHLQMLEKDIDEFNERFSQEVRAVFSINEIENIEKIAEYYKEITIKHPVKPVLCHHDLHFYNLMFDTKNKRITGLLDFGCAGYSEPARDWHYYFHPDYVLEGYGDIGDKYFPDRQEFHALSWSLNNLGDEISEGKQPYPFLEYIKDYTLNK